jgi:hypothetical protein
MRPPPPVRFRMSFVLAGGIPDCRATIFIFARFLKFYFGEE